MNLEKYFDDTLTEFYQNSNEIELHSEIFDKHILPELDKYPRLNWLEVGIGKGEKLVNHLNGLNTKPNLTVIEPSKKWLNQLSNSGNLNKLESLSNNITIFNSTFEQFNEALSISDFDYISFNQVIYDDSIFQSLMEFIDSNKNRKPYWVHINLENETSDLYNLRQKLKMEILDISTSQLLNIEEYFVAKKIKYNSFITCNKILTLDLEKLKKGFNYWFYPFVLGLSKTTFNKLDIKFKENIKITILDYISQRNQLKIDDTSLLIKLSN